jgi:hypothetical protein
VGLHEQEREWESGRRRECYDKGKTLVRKGKVGLLLTVMVLSGTLTGSAARFRDAVDFTPGSFPLQRTQPMSVVGVMGNKGENVAEWRRWDSHNRPKRCE